MDPQNGLKMLVQLWFVFDDNICVFIEHTDYKSNSQRDIQPGWAHTKIDTFSDHIIMTNHLLYT